MTYSKEDWRAVAAQKTPNITDEQFEVMWLEFCDMVARADALKAQGIAIHPTFGLRK